MTVEWTVEFWFKYALDEMNIFNFNNEVLIAGHDVSIVFSLDPCFYDTNFQFSLVPVINNPYTGQRYPKTVIKEGAFTQVTLDRPS